MITPTYPPATPSIAHLEAQDVYRHPIVDEIDYIERARRREAAEHRLASASRRATPQVTRLRTRVGTMLVRAGYSLGAPKTAA